MVLFVIILKEATEQQLFGLQKNLSPIPNCESPQWEQRKMLPEQGTGRQRRADGADFRGSSTCDSEG